MALTAVLLNFAVMILFVHLKRTCECQPNQNHEPLLNISLPNTSNIYSASWASLDSRPLPDWYDDAKFGIFVHWGVFSVPGVFSEWFWYRWRERWEDPAEFMARNYPPGFTYADFASAFKAELFNATQWAELIARSGAKYFVFTSKHHDGFANWNTSYSPQWNSVAVGPHRDIVGELASAFRNHGDIKFGLYFSLFEWYNPLYLKDAGNNFTTKKFVKATSMFFRLPLCHKEIVEVYKPDYLWSDGDWAATDAYWESKEFLAWLYNERKDSRPQVGKCHVSSERLVGYQKGKSNGRLSHYSRNYTRTCYDSQERLDQIGDWLNVNGEAIYGTKPWKAQNDTNTPSVWYTSKGENVYAIALKWPKSGRLVLDAPVPSLNTKVTMLGLENMQFDWNIILNPLYLQNSTTGTSNTSSDITNHMENKSVNASDIDKNNGNQTLAFSISVPPIAISDLPSLWAWVFKLTNVY